jgi:hypothetical protein
MSPSKYIVMRNSYNGHSRYVSVLCHLREWIISIASFFSAVKEFEVSLSTHSSTGPWTSILKESLALGTSERGAIQRLTNKKQLTISDVF